MGYTVTEEGIPFGPKGYPLQTIVDEGGYHRFNVSIDTEKRKVAVARLQAWQKFGEKIFEPGLEVRHLDGDSGNNARHNIEIGTKSQNTMDKLPEVRLRVARTAAQARRKLSDDEVVSLRQDRSNGMKVADVAAKYGISKGNASDIINGKLYAYKASEISGTSR